MLANNFFAMTAIKGEKQQLLHRFANAGGPTVV